MIRARVRQSDLRRKKPAIKVWRKGRLVRAPIDRSFQDVLSFVAGDFYAVNIGFYSRKPKKPIIVAYYHATLPLFNQVVYKIQDGPMVKAELWVSATDVRSWFGRLPERLYIGIRSRWADKRPQPKQLARTSDKHDETRE